MHLAPRCRIRPKRGKFVTRIVVPAQDGEIKALLSTQQSVRTVKFGGRPSSANSRSMAKPNSAKEPGPGQYIDPMKEGRGDNGEVWQKAPPLPLAHTSTNEMPYFVCITRSEQFCRHKRELQASYLLANRTQPGFQKIALGLRAHRPALVMERVLGSLSLMVTKKYFQSTGIQAGRSGVHLGGED